MQVDAGRLKIETFCSPQSHDFLKSPFEGKAQRLQAIDQILSAQDTALPQNPLLDKRIAEGLGRRLLDSATVRGRLLWEEAAKASGPEIMTNSELLVKCFESDEMMTS